MIAPVARTVAAMWEEYHTQVYPLLHPHSSQYKELERTFYSGVMSLYSWLTEDLDADDEPTDNDMARMEKLDTELRTYFISKIAADVRQWHTR